MACCKPTCQKWTTFSLSIAFLLLGLITVSCWGVLYGSLLRHELSVENTETKGFEMWQETPIPMYMHFYLWNWTNAEEVIKSKWAVKPAFEECGPYTYYEHHIRNSVRFFDNNNTVRYNTTRIWRYLPDKSKGSLQDKITTVNPILATITYVMRDKPAYLKLAISFFLKEYQVKVFITKTVDEFIFKGYKDKMLDLAKKFKNISHFDVPFNRFGWFYNRNGSTDHDGVFDMYTGGDDIEKLGRIIRWNHRGNVPFYEGNCGVVRGTSGELWYPPRNASTVYIFASDICGSLELKYRNDPFYLYGIKGRKYIGNQKVFDNGTFFPEMTCFKPKGVHLTSGVRNISQCQFGAPAFLSYPHFYLADPSYVKAVNGMEPNQKQHEFYIILEPNTGLPLEVNAALQVNLYLAPIKGFGILNDVKPTFMPMMWFKQTAELSESLCNQGKLLLVLPSVGYYTGFGIIGLGSMFMLIALFITFRKAWKDNDEEQLINQEAF